MASEIFIICKTVPKLKHVALWEIYYQVLNTSLIFMYNCWNKCCCHEFQGCRLKPLHQRLNGLRNYCFVCRVRTTYNIDKTCKLKRIAEILTHIFKWRKTFNCVSILVATIFGYIIIKQMEIENLVKLIDNV